MKIYAATLMVVSLTVPLAARAESPPIVNAGVEKCSGIKWSVSFLERYPKAPAACRAVETLEGVKYAKFVGKVSKVGSTFVEVAVTDVADYPISTIAFEIGVGGRITVNDKVEKVSELKVDDRLTFWVKEGDFGISPTLTDKPMRILKPDAMPAT